MVLIGAILILRRRTVFRCALEHEHTVRESVRVLEHEYNSAARSSVYPHECMLNVSHSCVKLKLFAG